MCGCKKTTTTVMPPTPRVVTTPNTTIKPSVTIKRS